MTNQNELQNAWGAFVEEPKENVTVVEETEKEGLDYLATPEGDTRVRIMDIAPFVYKEWWSVQGNGGEGNGTSIPYKGSEDLLEKDNKAHMSKVFAEADKRGYKKGSKERTDFLRENGYKKCPWGNGGKVKEKAIIHVIDRADGKLKLMDKTKGFFESLRDFALDPEYGDLRNYDITIKRTGTGWQDTKYAITPARSNTPLTDAEIKLYKDKKANLEELKGGANVSPEQAYAVAKGALWTDVFADDWTPLSHEKDATKVETKKDENLVDFDKVREDMGIEKEPVNVETGQALTEDELAGIDFNA